MRRKEKIITHSNLAISLAEWTELDDKIENQSQLAHFGFYDFVPVFAYAILSCLLFAYIILSIAKYDGAFNLLAFVSSIGFAMLAIGRAIELRSTKEIT